jgi:serine protease Do
MWLRLAQPATDHGGAAAPVGTTAIEQAAAIVGPTVVNIDTETVQPRIAATSHTDPLRHFFEPAPHGDGPDIQNGVGSGVLVSSDGYILTNEHVIHGATSIKVTLTNHRHYQGRVVGADELTDVAIVKIDEHGLPVAQLGDSDSMQIGEWVIAVGNPYQFEHTVTAGVISGRGRTLPDEFKEYRDLLQTDAAINPGNSGGPLCDLHGRVVGINTAILPYAQGIGFAIPINAAHQTMDQLIAHGHVIRPFIGITMQDVSEETMRALHLSSTSGVLVMGVVPGSPAETAGLKRGDVIIRFAGHKFQTPAEFQGLVRSQGVGTKQDLDYVREGTVHSMAIRVAEMPDLDKLRNR